MKQPLFLLFVVLLMACSCSDEILNEDNHQAILGTSNVTFSFDSITEPSNWRKYQSLEEMLAACQIPEDKLKSMSTDELIEVCMSHPLHMIFVAYNNQLDGAKVIIDSFNGFQELKLRDDAASRLLSFYEDVNFNCEAKSIRRRDFSSSTLLGFIELFLASKELPQLYERNNIQELKRISDKVLEQKLLKNQGSFMSIRHSLLLNSQIKLEDKTLSDEDRDLLNRFVKVGGMCDDANDYTKVSKITVK